MTSNDDAPPLPLDQLRDRISASTYDWLLEAESSSQALAENDEDETGIHLFAPPQEDDDDDEDEYYPRVQEWASSVDNPDGIGGYAPRSGGDSNAETTTVTNGDDSSTIVRVKYILSDAPGGHGDDIWAASRHVSNCLADPVKCRRLLLLQDDAAASKDDDSAAPTRATIGKRTDMAAETARATCANQQEDQPSQQSRNVLRGRRFLELGAGGGIPSWTALQCGAHVVCTDQPIASRIRALAEAAERNVLARKKENTNTSMPQAKVCPYSWGTPVDEVIGALQDDDNNNNDDNGFDKRLFDVVVAADCIYVPELHTKLLMSIQMLLKRRGGVALLPFALHGNTADEKVWAIVDTASRLGFDVQVLESQQLTPQIGTMDAKRGLVHTLRLTKQS